MSKSLLSKPTPGAYRDGPDHYSDADPPAYEDVANTSIPTPARNHGSQSYLIQPTLPDSHVSWDGTTTTTHWPLYTQDAKSITEMLREQAKYPPQYTALIIGTHVEPNSSNSEPKLGGGFSTVDDFYIRLDMTHLLVPSPDASHSLLCQDSNIPLPGVKAYRGHRTKTDCSQESAPDAEAYIHSYTSSSFPVRSFTLNRRILHHDSAALKALITAIVRSTNYRGDLSVTFLITHSHVTVYSPCWQNHYREKLWLRWIFYLTFLWVISWPYLWFMTRRWEVVTAESRCSTAPECENKQDTTKSGESFVKEWETSIRRAVLERKQGWIDEDYKLETEKAKAQAGPDGYGTMPGTGNAMK